MTTLGITVAIEHDSNPQEQGAEKRFEDMLESGTIELSPDEAKGLMQECLDTNSMHARTASKLAGAHRKCSCWTNVACGGGVVIVVTRAAHST